MERQKSTSQTITHHLYGEIPLIAEGTITTDDYGNPIDQRWWRPDPNFQPPLPVGAVQGHPHLQDYCWFVITPNIFMSMRNIAASSVATDSSLLLRNSNFGTKPSSLISTPKPSGAANAVATSGSNGPDTVN